MRRRDFIVALASVVGVSPPFFARAQQGGKMYRIALVRASGPASEMTENNPVYSDLLGELRRLGYVEGQNLIVERYSGGGDSEGYRKVAADVVRGNPDAVFALHSQLVLEFKAQTTTIPIVGGVYDPVGLGVVPNLARPGGNITGVDAEAGQQTWGKRLALLKEAMPTLSRVGLLIVPTMIGRRGAATVKEVSAKIGVSLVDSHLASPFDEAAYRRAFAVMVEERVEAVYVGSQYETWTSQQLIVDLAQQNRLLTICGTEGFVEMGGLMAYRPDWTDALRHAAQQIDQILKGTKPGDIPFYQGSKFQFAVNLKTAKLLGIEIPNSILAQADEVIE
jgi:putative ABC transport system substrate-binding protein